MHVTIVKRNLKHELGYKAAGNEHSMMIRSVKVISMLVNRFFPFTILKLNPLIHLLQFSHIEGKDIPKLGLRNKKEYSIFPIILNHRCLFSTSKLWLEITIVIFQLANCGLIINTRLWIQWRTSRYMWSLLFFQDWKTIDIYPSTVPYQLEHTRNYRNHRWLSYTI